VSATTNAGPLLSVRDLRVHFRLGHQGLLGTPRLLRAVDGVSFDLAHGETLGIVGESGCGKSTLARALLRLVAVTAGEVRFRGEDLLRLEGEALRQRRRALQPVFQDPLASLNPRMTVGEIIAEPLRAFFPGMNRRQRREKVVAMMDRVGLLARQINRYPHEFSGGQAQRIGIARALVLEPEVVICDEPVSALDVSIKSQIINLLQDLQRDMGLSLLFIAHDLAAVRHISHRVMVLYLGHVVELADRDALYRRPRHPYTQALIRAIPDPDPRRARERPVQPLAGEPPSPVSPPSGCVFRTRCPYAAQRCADEVPALRRLDGSDVACHFAETLPAAAFATR
jgi:oligopeptide transport system ATP-binding protein